MTSSQDALLMILRTEGPKTVPELRDITGRGIRNVHKSLSSLAKYDLVRKDGENVWEAVE